MTVSTSHTALERAWHDFVQRKKMCPCTELCFSFNDQQGLTAGLKMSVRGDQLTSLLFLIFFQKGQTNSSFQQIFSIFNLVHA